MAGEEEPTEAGGMGGAADADSQAEAEGAPESDADVTEVTEFSGIEAQRESLMTAAEQLSEAPDRPTALEALRGAKEALEEMRDGMDRIGKKPEIEELQGAAWAQNILKKSWYKSLNDVASVTAIFFSPTIELLNVLQRELITSADFSTQEIRTIVAILTNLVFLIDTVVQLSGKMDNYKLNSGINVTAMVSDLVELIAATMGGVNSRVLRLLRLFRVTGLAFKSDIVPAVIAKRLAELMESNFLVAFFVLILIISTIEFIPAGISLLPDFIAPLSTELAPSLSGIGLAIGIMWIMQNFRATTHRILDKGLTQEFVNEIEKVLLKLEQKKTLAGNPGEILRARMEEFKARNEGQEMTEIAVMGEIIDMIIDRLGVLLSSAEQEDLLRGKEEASEREGVVVFTDIRGFTDIMSKYGLDIIPWLNEYFGARVEIVAEFGGDVDNFIGDALMIVFPDADGALRFMIEMNRMEKGLREVDRVAEEHGVSLDQVADEYRDRGSERHVIGPGTRKLQEEMAGQEFSTRAGANACRYIQGAVGGKKRKRVTRLGDGINLASRLEYLCGHYGVDLLVSGDTVRQVQGKEIESTLRFVDRVGVKGREDSPTALWTIDVEPKDPGFLRLFEEGRDLYLDGNWEEAFVKLRNAQLSDPDDGPTQTLINRILATKTRHREMTTELAQTYPEIIEDRRVALLKAIGARDFTPPPNFRNVTVHGSDGHKIEQNVWVFIGKSG